jgi:hypothetical protein
MGPHKWVLKVNEAPLGALFAAYLLDGSLTGKQYTHLYSELED